MYLTNDERLKAGIIYNLLTDRSRDFISRFVLPKIVQNIGGYQY